MFGYTSIEFFFNSEKVLILRDLSMLKVEQFIQLVWVFGKLIFLRLEFLIKVVSDMLLYVIVYFDEELCMILNGCVQVLVDN